MSLYTCMCTTQKTVYFMLFIIHVCRANQTKLLRLERDNRELERSLHVLKLSSEKASAEMEKMNRKQTAQIHADKKEIARLKEVGLTSVWEFWNRNSLVFVYMYMDMYVC